MAPLPSSTSDEGGSIFDIFKQFSCGINFADVLSCDPHPVSAVEEVSMQPKAVKARPADGFNKRNIAIGAIGRNSEDPPVDGKNPELDLTVLRIGNSQSAIARAEARRQNLPALDSPEPTPGQPVPPLPPTNASTAKQEQANPVVSRTRSAEQAPVSRISSGGSGASGSQQPGSGGGARSLTLNPQPYTLNPKPSFLNPQPPTPNPQPPARNHTP